jgi:PAS domain S-box-containing protein
MPRTQTSENPDSGFLAKRAAELFAAGADYERALLAATRRAVPDFADWCVVDYYATDGELRAVHSGHPKEKLMLAVRRRYREQRGDEGEILTALRTGKPLLYRDTTQVVPFKFSPEDMVAMREIGATSSIIVPMHERETPLGVISFVSMSRHYDEDDLAAAQEFAAGCARVLSQSRMRGEVERSLALLDTLYSTTPVGLAFIDTALCFRRVNQRLAALTGLPAGDHVDRTISEVFPELGERLSRPFNRALGGDGGEFELKAATPGDPHAIRDWLIYYKPVRLAGEPVGLSCVVQDITERRRAEARTAFLVRVGEVLESSLDYTQTLQDVARIAVPTLATWCTISMGDESGRLRRLAVAHADPAMKSTADELLGLDPIDDGGSDTTSHVARTGETRIIDAFIEERLPHANQNPRSLELMREMGLGSAVVVPLIARGATLGVLSLVADAPSAFSPEDVEFVRELARRAALGIDNARLYTERSRAAKIFESSLLPRSLPDIPGVELAARYRPVGEDVGGDFYDVFSRSEDEWLVVVGDVTGKGVEAAATTALIRYTLRTLAMLPGEPSALLGRLNEAMRNQEASLCTVALLGVRAGDGDSPEVTVSLAGHPQPLLLGRAGEIATVGAPGTILGLAAQPQFTDSRLQLRESETLIVFTDGLTDAAAPPSLTDAQLLERVRSSVRVDLGDTLGELEAAAVAAADGHPRDDIALVAIRPVAQPS